MIAGVQGIIQGTDLACAPRAWDFACEGRKDVSSSSWAGSRLVDLSSNESSEPSQTQRGLSTVESQVQQIRPYRVDGIRMINPNAKAKANATANANANANGHC